MRAAVSEFKMQFERRHQHGAAIPVIARVVDVLEAGSHIDSAPNVRRVIGFDDVFSAITKRAITEQETESPIGEINLMVFANSIGHHGQASTVVYAMP